MKKVIRIYDKAKHLIITMLRVLKRKNGCQRFILIGSPLHGNIGDHAISIAERIFIKDYFKNGEIIEIAGIEFKFLKSFLSKLVRKDDIIMITGGGFLGSLWINEEEMVREVIIAFQNNRIFIMPQTVYYSEDNFGREELEKSKEIYKQHKRINFFLREEKSFDFVKKNFKGMETIDCVPDIVTYLNFVEPQRKREGVLFCFREDKEKIFNSDEVQKVSEYFRDKGEKIFTTTTVLKESISFKNREKIFLQKIEEFKKSRLIVTDRLHGMLFAAITGTPCIALDNLSGKVKGVYKWIANLEYIQFANSFEKMKEYAEPLMRLNVCRYDNEILKKELYRIIENMEGK